jgi:hypothetical protein
MRTSRFAVIRSTEDMPCKQRVVLCTTQYAGTNNVEVYDLEKQGAVYVRTSIPGVLSTLIRWLRKILSDFMPAFLACGDEHKTVPELIALIARKSGYLLEYLEECIDEDAQAAQDLYKQQHSLPGNPWVMFHGTGKKASDGILNIGFHRTQGARAKWGEGTYVSNKIHEALRYTAELKDMTVLVLNMHVGDTAVGSKGQKLFVDSSKETLPAVHTLTSKDKRIYVGSGEPGQLLIVARSSWTFVKEFMSPENLQTIGGGNNQVNACYRGYMASLPQAVRVGMKPPWEDVSAYNSNEFVYAVIPAVARVLKTRSMHETTAGGPAGGAAAPAAGGAAAGQVAAQELRAAYLHRLHFAAKAAWAPVAAGAAAGAPSASLIPWPWTNAGAAAAAAGAPLTPQKRRGGHVAGSASKAPKREDLLYSKSLDQCHGFKVGDRVQITDVFAPYYRIGTSLIGDFACVRAIGQNTHRTILLVEMESESNTAFVKKVNKNQLGPPRSAFPYVTWSSTEQQADHLLAVRPGEVKLA